MLSCLCLVTSARVIAQGLSQNRPNYIRLGRSTRTFVEAQNLAVGLGLELGDFGGSSDACPYVGLGIEHHDADLPACGHVCELYLACMMFVRNSIVTFLFVSQARLYI